MSFPHLALIFIVALIVLGPQKMPKLVAQVGRWAGKARAMARQFREQLENEINLDELNKASTSAKTPPPDQFHPPYGHEAPATETVTPAATEDVAAATEPVAADSAPAADTVVPPEATHPAVAQSTEAAEPAAGEPAAETVTAWVPDVHDGTQFAPAPPETISPTPMVGTHERGV